MESTRLSVVLKRADCMRKVTLPLQEQKDWEAVNAFFHKHIGKEEGVRKVRQGTIVGRKKQGFMALMNGAISIIAVLLRGNAQIWIGFRSFASRLELTVHSKSNHPCLSNTQEAFKHLEIGCCLKNGDYDRISIQPYEWYVTGATAESEKPELYTLWPKIDSGEYIELQAQVPNGGMDTEEKNSFSSTTTTEDIRSPGSSKSQTSTSYESPSKEGSRTYSTKKFISPPTLRRSYGTLKSQRGTLSPCVLFEEDSIV